MPVVGEIVEYQGYPAMVTKVLDPGPEVDLVVFHGDHNLVHWVKSATLLVPPPGIEGTAAKSGKVTDADEDREDADENEDEPTRPKARKHR